MSEHWFVNDEQACHFRITNLTVSRELILSKVGDVGIRVVENFKINFIDFNTV